MDLAVGFGTRSAHLTLVAAERPFRLSFWENQGEKVEMAGGRASDLFDAAAAIQSVLEHGEQKISDLIRDFPFLEMEPFGLSWERGTYIEDHWQSMLLKGVAFYAETFPSGDPLFHRDQLAELIARAAERPALRRLMPYTSLNRFSVRSQLPNSEVAVIWPLGDGRYALIGEYSGERLAKGDASVVLDALVDQVEERDA